MTTTTIWVVIFVIYSISIQSIAECLLRAVATRVIVVVNGVVLHMCSLVFPTAVDRGSVTIIMGMATTVGMTASVCVIFFPITVFVILAVKSFIEHTALKGLVLMIGNGLLASRLCLNGQLLKLVKWIILDGGRRGMRS